MKQSSEFLFFMLLLLGFPLEVTADISELEQMTRISEDLFFLQRYRVKHIWRTSQPCFLTYYTARSESL